MKFVKIISVIVIFTVIGFMMVSMTKNVELQVEKNIDTQIDETYSGELDTTVKGDTQAIQPEELTGEEKIDEFADWGGEYFTENKKMLELQGPGETGGVDFEISHDNILCEGFSAVAYLEKSGVANFYDATSKCQINLTYNPGVVEVNSYDCGEYEDAQCDGFTGTYRLK